MATEPSKEAVERLEPELEHYGMGLMGTGGVQATMKADPQGEWVSYADYVKARNRWEQEVRERLEAKQKALNARAETRFEDGDQVEANQLIAFATGIQIALDSIFGEAD